MFEIYTVICGYVVENIFQFDRNACMGSHHHNTNHSDFTEKTAFGKMQMPAPTTNQTAPPAIQPEDIQMHTPPSLATTPS